jgi:hypothetical protein
MAATEVAAGCLHPRAAAEEAAATSGRRFLLPVFAIRILTTQLYCQMNSRPFFQVSCPQKATFRLCLTQNSVAWACKQGAADFPSDDPKRRTIDYEGMQTPRQEHISTFLKDKLPAPASQFRFVDSLNVSCGSPPFPSRV